MKIGIIVEEKTRSIAMSKPSQAWVSIHPKTAAISIFVNDGFHKSLIDFARQRGIALQFISPDALTNGGRAVTLEYHTSLGETDAKHLLGDWEALREQQVA